MSSCVGSKVLAGSIGGLWQNKVELFDSSITAEEVLAEVFVALEPVPWVLLVSSLEPCLPILWALIEMVAWCGTVFLSCSATAVGSETAATTWSPIYDPYLPLLSIACGFTSSRSTTLSLFDVV